MALNPIWLASFKEEKRHTQGEGHVMREAEIKAASQVMPRIAGNYQKLGRNKRFSLMGFRGSMALPTT